jgi:hypothetical protein
MARELLLLPTTTYRAADFLAAAKRMNVEVVAAAETPEAQRTKHELAGGDDSGSEFSDFPEQDLHSQAIPSKAFVFQEQSLFTRIAGRKIQIHYDRQMV